MSSSTLFCLIFKHLSCFNSVFKMCFLQFWVLKSWSPFFFNSHATRFERALQLCFAKSGKIMPYFWHILTMSPRDKPLTLRQKRRERFCLSRTLPVYCAQRQYFNNTVLWWNKRRASSANVFHQCFPPVLFWFCEPSTEQLCYSWVWVRLSF